MEKYSAVVSYGTVNDISRICMFHLLNSRLITTTMTQTEETETAKQSKKLRSKKFCSLSHSNTEHRASKQAGRIETDKLYAFMHKRKRRGYYRKNNKQKRERERRKKCPGSIFWLSNMCMKTLEGYTVLIERKNLARSAKLNIWHATKLQKKLNAYAAARKAIKCAAARKAIKCAAFNFPLACYSIYSIIRICKLCKK